MKVQYCSDLHLEFSENRSWLKENPIIPKAEILLIAGDTYYLNRNYAKLDFIKKVSDEFKHVYLIPGNHEYYDGFNASSALEPFELSVKNNVTIINNKCVQIEDVDFIFSTFWSLIKNNPLIVMQGMVDFRRIKFNKEKFNFNHFNDLHHKAFEFVSNQINSDKKTVVMTHHLPSSLCNAAEFKNSPLTEAFCVEKTNFIMDSDIDYWIYGHSHRNLTDFSISDTKLITNQMGYVTWNEHHRFNLEKVFEI